MTRSRENEILSYLEMCRREHLSLQRGMNFAAGKGYSIILMSQRPGAPYVDQIADGGSTLIYEGHDVPRSDATPRPKTINQQEFAPSGKRTENGKFRLAADEFKKKTRPAERVRVYEKIRDGIWSYNGLFHLTDSWTETQETRIVFKFKLLLVDDDTPNPPGEPPARLQDHRIIPSSVKIAVWKRDGGACVMCGVKDNLHFDHVIPHAKGGASTTAENVQLLCSRHNLEKRDRIV